MANFCGKCGAKLEEQTGKCPNCDKLIIREIHQTDNSVGANNQLTSKINTDVTDDKKSSQKECKAVRKAEKKAHNKKQIFLRNVAFLLCAAILACGVSGVLAYFNIVNIPFVYNIMDMLGIIDDEVSFVGQSSESSYKPNEDNIIYENEDKSFGYVNNMILVFFSNNATETQITEVVSSISGEVVGKIDGINQYQIQVEATTKDNLNKICEELLKFDVVKNAIIDYVVTTTTNETPNDPWKDTFQGAFGVDWNENNPSGTNWWFEATKISSAWEYSDHFSNINVGVVDNGYDTEHEDLNITVLNNEVNNFENHGTHVAGVIGATVNNSKGISGILKDVSLYGVDCYSTSKQKKENITVSSLYEGINLCIQNDCKVINMSSGIEYTDKDETKNVSYEMAKYAANCLVYLLDSYDKEFLVVQSAGNGDDWGNGVNAKDYNGWFSAIDEAVVQELFDEYEEKGVKTEHQITVQDVMDSFVVVAAVDEKQKKGEYQLSSFSNYGDTVTVCAPGVNVFSTIKSGGLNGSYGYMDVTSMAAPIVSGITSLVWSVDQEMSSGEVKQIITETATQKVLSRNRKDNGTYFMIDAKAAVEKAIEKRNAKENDTLTKDESNVPGSETKKQLTRIDHIDENGDISEYELFSYDENGNIKSIVRSSGESRTLTYDANGKLLWAISGEPADAYEPGANCGWGFEYDDEGRLVKEYFWEGGYYETIHQYDDSGKRVRSVTDYDGMGTETEDYTYDEEGVLIKSGTFSIWVTGEIESVNKSYDYRCKPFVVSLSNNGTSTFELYNDEGISMLEVALGYEFGFENPQYYLDEAGYLQKVVEDGRTVMVCYYDGETSANDKEETEETKPTLLEANGYEDILDMYYSGISCQWTNRDEYGDVDPADPDSVLSYRYAGDTLLDVGYALVDLNRDGQEELLISRVEDADEGLIYGLYTIIDGRVNICISTPIKGDWCKLAKDGSVLSKRFGGAAKTVLSNYYLDLEGELRIRSGVIREEPQKFYSFAEEYKNDYSFPPITEQEANAIIENFPDPAELKLIPFAQYK